MSIYNHCFKFLESSFEDKLGQASSAPCALQAGAPTGHRTSRPPAAPLPAVPSEQPGSTASSAMALGSLKAEEISFACHVEPPSEQQFWPLPEHQF